MSRTVRFTTLILTIVILNISVSYGKDGVHPALGYDPKPLPSNYGTEYYGLGPEYDYGDITFHSPYPDVSTLSDAEKYMIAGCVDSELGGPLGPWYRDIFMMVNSIAFETDYSVIPDKLEYPMIRARTVKPAEFTQDDADRFRSPITGEFPRLDAVEFAPGQVYIRLLTEEEKEHFASKVKHYHEHWYEGVDEFKLTGEVLPIKLTTEVFYMRVYGENGVLSSRIMYDFEYLEEPKFELPENIPER